MFKPHRLLPICIFIGIAAIGLQQSSQSGDPTQYINTLVNMDILDNSYSGLVSRTLTEYQAHLPRPSMARVIQTNEPFNRSALCVYIVNTTHKHIEHNPLFKQFPTILNRLHGNMLSIGSNLILMDSNLVDFLAVDAYSSMMLFYKMTADDIATRKHSGKSREEDSFYKFYGAIAAWQKLKLIEDFRSSNSLGYIRRLKSDIRDINSSDPSPHSIFSLYAIPYLGHELGHINYVPNDKETLKERLKALVWRFRDIAFDDNLDQEAYADAYARTLTERIVRKRFAGNSPGLAFQLQPVFEMIKLLKFNALFDVLEPREPQSYSDHFVKIIPKTHDDRIDPFNISNIRSAEWVDLDKQADLKLKELCNRLINGPNMRNAHRQYIRAILLGVAIKNHVKHPAFDSAFANIVFGDVISLKLGESLLGPLYDEVLKNVPLK